MTITQPMSPEVKLAIDLVRWLEGCNCYKTRPVVVTIEDREYVGCFYFQRSKPFNPYADDPPEDEYSLYVVGTLPPSYKKKPHPVYRLEESCADWYVACHMEEVTDQFAQYHPFGPNFILKPWIFEEVIDAHESVKYRRVPVIVEDL